MSRHPPFQTYLSLDAWPCADRDAWLAATSAGTSLLRDSGAASHLATVTQNDLTRRYGYFLHFVLAADFTFDDTIPAAAVSPETVSKYMTAMDARLSSITLANSMRKIYRVAGILAPHIDWTWLKTLCRHLDVNARPTNKRPRIVEIDGISRLGHTLMERAEIETALPAFTRALLYRDGLIIALLTATLLRRGNLASLVIDKTIVNSGSGWLIAIPGSKSKNGQPIEMRLPDDLSFKVDHYLENYRSKFRRHEIHAALWLSRNGRPLSASQLFHIISNRTRDAFGRAINPHLVRDCAVTSIAMQDGANIRIASAALGHRDPRTTEKYYNQCAMIDAVRCYQTDIVGSPNGEKS